MKKMLFRGILSLGLAATSLIGTTFAEAPQDVKEWTYLVFINADNNLDRFGVGDLNEMAEIGSTENVNIVVQLDRAYGKPAKRYFVQKGDTNEVQDLGEVDMGSVKTLTDFVEWGSTNYPAEKYATVIWNHGSGWNKKASNTVFKGISYDDESGNHITTAQLTGAAKDIRDILGKKLDILAFDACLMQMLEVSYAVKNDAKIMLASQETEPGEGWAYNDSLKELVNKKGLSAEEVSTIIVDTYDKSYDNGSQGNSSTTQSWVDLSKTDALVDSLNTLADHLMDGHKDLLTSSVSKVQKFYYRSNVDLIHLLELFDAELTGEASVACKAALKAANEFVGHHGTHGAKMKNSKGTAIYFPSRGYSFSDKYLNLDFAKASKWDEMLKAFYAAAKTREQDL
ncbi:MAG: hypothetical protein KC646_03410 [Candidatus Cloacimonetes bacterium]|nr:hypothetical protein [Candidatus Cloacimonadota bacterium]